MGTSLILALVPLDDMSSIIAMKRCIDVRLHLDFIAFVFSWRPRADFPEISSEGLVPT